MKQYDSYKDSGMEWITVIPSHWELKKLKSISIIENSGVWGEDDDKTNLIPVKIPTTAQLSIDGRWDLDNMNTRYLTEKDWEKYCSITGDIIVVKSSGSSSNIITGKCGYISESLNRKFSFSNFLMRVRPLNVNSKLIYYFLQSNLTKQRIERMVSSTTYPNLKVDEYTNSIIPLPPISEQEHIVSYLDYKTTKIDELIQKKLRKIDLLKEYRTSLINTVVTKGLNSNVPMKDSGIEWIGEIPSHWEKSRLDFLFRLYGRVGWKSLKSDEYVEDGYVFLSTPNIKDKVIDYVNVNYITKERYDESPEIMLENGDVLLVKDGSTLGIVNIVVDLPRPSTVNSSIGVLKKISDKISPMFMYYHLTSDYHQNIINRIKGGMGVPHLFQSDIKKFDVILPPLSEQEHIVSYLDVKTSQIDKTIDIEKKKIELLKEYRQSLISNVVTGKIKVI
jgi:type I restriction enzyme S subunit